MARRRRCACAIVSPGSPSPGIVSRMLDELDDREDALASGARVDDGDREMVGLEADHEIRVDEPARGEGLGSMAGEVDSEPRRRAHRFRQRALIGPTSSVPTDRIVTRARPSRRRRTASAKRASRTVPVADEDDLEAARRIVGEIALAHRRRQ